MNIKWAPLLASFALSAALLFGGWHFYHSYALQNPLSEQLESLDGVLQADTTINGSEVIVTIHLDQNASLRSIVQTIMSEGSSYMKNRKLTLDIQDHPSPELEAWWSSVLFEVAQAMETKTYSHIPDLMNESEDGRPQGMKAEAEIDEHYVYIRMVHGEHVKFVMLPRVPTELERWLNA